MSNFSCYSVSLAVTVSWNHTASERQLARAYLWQVVQVEVRTVMKVVKWMCLAVFTATDRGVVCDIRNFWRVWFLVTVLCWTSVMSQSFTRNWEKFTPCVCVCVWLACMKQNAVFALSMPLFVSPFFYVSLNSWVISLTVFGTSITSLNKPPRALAASTIMWIRSETTEWNTRFCLQWPKRAVVNKSNAG